MNSMMLTSLGCGVLGGVGITWALLGGSSDAGAKEADHGLEVAVEACKREIAGLRGRVNALENRPSPIIVQEDVRRDPVSEPEEKPRKVAEEAPVKVPSSEPSPTQELESWMEDVLFQGFSEEKVEGFLGYLQTRSVKDLIPKIESRLGSIPSEGRAQYMMAKVYLQALMRDPTYSGKEKWGNLVMDAYDKAIEADPEFWEPRFDKAESLTYYPESEGKLPEAIRQFEDLLDLQGESTDNPKYKETYAHLARLYVRINRNDRALEVLEEGLRLFPDDEDLRKQMNLLQSDDRAPR